jgi:hypothetical protein
MTSVWYSLKMDNCISRKRLQKFYSCRMVYTSAICSKKCYPHIASCTKMYNINYISFSEVTLPYLVRHPTIQSATQQTSYNSYRGSVESAESVQDIARRGSNSDFHPGGTQYVPRQVYLHIRGDFCFSQSVQANSSVAPQIRSHHS